MADLAAPHGIDFPEPAPAQRKALSDILGPIVTIANPLDYHTFIWGDGPRTEAVFTEMLKGYDAGIFVIDPPRPDHCDPSSFQPALDAIVAAGRTTGKPAFPVASLPENFDEDRAIAMIANGVAPLMGLDAALGAIKAAQVLPGRPGWRPATATGLRETRLLDEAEGKALLASAGVAVPRSVSGGTLGEVRARAGDLAAPYALKGLGFSHKTEAGAVRLGLPTLDGQEEMQGATGYLVEEMIEGAVAEVLLGLRRDPVYGVTLTVGLGGVSAELLADTVTMVWPVDAEEIAAETRRLRLWPLLDGYRGRPRADMAAVADIACRLGRLMEERAEIEEIEINPILVREAGSGAVAVDALVREAQ